MCRIDLFASLEAANNVTFVDSRHQNKHTENRPTNFMMRVHGSSIEEVDLGVSVSESFDSFLARLSSQAAFTDAIARVSLSNLISGLKVTTEHYVRQPYPHDGFEGSVSF
jgi:hypothetical protein